MVKPVIDEPPALINGNDMFKMGIKPAISENYFPLNN
jgi:hypothetical protein